MYITENLPFQLCLSAKFHGIKYIHVLCHHGHQPFPELFSSSETKTMCALNSYSPFLLPWSLATTAPLAISVNLQKLSQFVLYKK